MRFGLTRPCAHCPFRADAKPYLTPERGAELAGYVMTENLTFPCHETTGKLSGEDRSEEEYQQCAGALHLHVREGSPNWRLRLAEGYGLWSATRLRLGEVVYAGAAAMVAAYARTPLETSSQKAPRHSRAAVQPMVPQPAGES